MELIIDCVSKRYQGKVWGLREFNLSLGSGIIGLVGFNGAGKSTLMRILATISNPTEGKVLWNGADVTRNPDRLRVVLGYLPQDFGVYPNLNAIEFLEYLAAAKGLERTAARERIDGLAGAGQPARCNPPPAWGIFRRDEAAGRHCPGSTQRTTCLGCISWLHWFCSWLVLPVAGCEVLVSSAPPSEEKACYY